MTPYETQILSACSGDWQTAEQIACKMKTRPFGKNIVPHLVRLEVRGLLIRDPADKFHRWRVR